MEVLEGEENMDVSVRAICDGELISKRTASGYGGLVVQKCELSGETVTVVYGHLDIKSINLEVGDKIKINEVLGELGEEGRVETDGERKHLHLGIHRGENVNIKGYVQTQTELSDWLDPCDYVCKK